MSFSNWKATFYKYNDENEDRFSMHGGILENGRAFEEQVSIRPGFFMPLLQEMLEDKKVKNSYLIHGLNGLIKANFSPVDVRALILKIIKKELSNTEVLYLTWNISYLVNNKLINDEIFDFLAYHSINNDDPQKDDDSPSQKSINSVRGSAIEKLMKINDKKFEKKLFKLLNKVLIIEKTDTVKFSIIYNSKFLLNINEAKAFGVFKKVLISNENLVSHGINSARYFSYKFFSKMKFFYDLALSKINCHKQLAQLLCYEYLEKRNEEQVSQFLFSLLKKSKVAQAEAISIAIEPRNLVQINGLLNEECMYIIGLFLKTTLKENVHQYSRAFLLYKENMFETLFPFLESYSKSNAFKNSPAYFCKYILKCCNKKNVYKCAELISCLDKLVKTDMTQGNYYDAEPLNLILAIYNSLGNSKKDFILKEKCMDIFDSMLQKPHYRKSASDVTSLVDL